MFSGSSRTWKRSILIDTPVDEIEDLLIDMEKNYVLLFPEHHKSFRYVLKTSRIKDSTFHLVEEFGDVVIESDGLIADFESGKRLVWKGSSGVLPVSVEFAYEAAGDQVLFTETVHLPLSKHLIRAISKVASLVTGTDYYEMFHDHFRAEPGRVKEVLERDPN